LLYNESKLEIEEHSHGSKPWPATSSTSTGSVVAVEKYLEDPLAEEFLRGTSSQGRTCWRFTRLVNN